VRNEPNLARPGGKCAKQSQTWEDWGIRAKAAVVWAVARPGVKRAKRTQFGSGGKMSGGPGAERHYMPGQPTIRSGAGSTKRRNVQNEPNSGRLETKCAEQSQLGEERIYAK
jgi:hypothetical protein